MRGPQRSVVQAAKHMLKTLDQYAAGATSLVEMAVTVERQVIGDWLRAMADQPSVNRETHDLYHSLAVAIETQQHHRWAQRELGGD